MGRLRQASGSRRASVDNRVIGFAHSVPALGWGGSEGNPTIAITQLYATRRAGLKQVSRKPRMILARDSHPVPGQYAWSGFATGAGGTRFVVSGLPSAAAVKTFIALQRRQLSR